MQEPTFEEKVYDFLIQNLNLTIDNYGSESRIRLQLCSPAQDKVYTISDETIRFDKD